MHAGDPTGGRVTDGSQDPDSGCGGSPVGLALAELVLVRRRRRA